MDKESHITLISHSSSFKNLKSGRETTTNVDAGDINIPTKLSYSRIRKMTIETDEFIEVGTCWWTVALYLRFSDLNDFCWKKLMKRNCRLMCLLFQIAATSGVIAFLFYSFFQFGKKFDYFGTFYAACICDMGLLIFLQCIFCVQLCRLCRFREHSEFCDIIYIVNLLAITIMSLYLIVILLLANNQNGWLFLAALFTIGFIENINILVWIIASFFLSFIFIIELTVRTITCKLACPRKEIVVREYEYKLYRYVTLKSKETTCMICLCDFIPAETICVLECSNPHLYHKNCIKAWLKKQNACPICRQIPKFKK